MSKTNKIIFLGAIALVLLFVVFRLVANPNQSSVTENNGQAPDSQVDHEVVFVFDYSCPWCSLWVDEVYPEMEPLLAKENVTFKTESLSVLDEKSLFMATMDYQVKKHYEDDYLDFFVQVSTDLLDAENLDMDYYIQQVIEQFDFDADLIFAEPDRDINAFTQEYVQKYEIDSVPTILIDGKKVQDPFDIEQIEEQL